jgi:hypothetical protein
VPLVPESDLLNLRLTAILKLEQNTIGSKVGLAIIQQVIGSLGGWRDRSSVFGIRGAIGPVRYNQKVRSIPSFVWKLPF